MTVFKYLIKSPHLTPTQHEHAIKHVILLSDQLIIDLLPELPVRVTLQSSDWPVQVLMCVISHVGHLGAHCADLTDIHGSATPSTARVETPVTQQSFQLLTHVLGLASPAVCNMTRELVVSHVLDLNWHVSQLALHWWCLLLDTHRDHIEICIQVLQTLIERHRQWTRNDTCQKETLATSLLESRVSSLLLHSLMHLPVAQQQRLVQMMDSPLRAHLSMTPLGLTLTSLFDSSSSLALLTRAVQMSLTEFTNTAPARLVCIEI